MSLFSRPPFRIAVWLMGLSLLLYSCTKDKSIEVSTQPNLAEPAALLRVERDDPMVQTKMVLGEKLNTPYSVENINQAKDVLYGASAPDKFATHRYIKFMPTTEEHLALLEDWETYGDIPFFDFPLDYEIVSGGDTYFDPAVADSTYTYRYTVVPIGGDLPEVPYEVVEDLYLDESDPLLLAESFLLTGNEEDVNDYALHGGLSPEEVEAYDPGVLQLLLIPEQPDEPCPPGYDWVLVIDMSQGYPIFSWECQPIDPPPPPADACTCSPPEDSKHPAGCVRVDNDGVMDPVQNAMVKVKGKFFFIKKTYTDENGCWHIDKKYHGNKLKVWVKFKNENVKVGDVGGGFIFFAVKDYVGEFYGPPYNDIEVGYGSSVSNNTSAARRYWAAAHTLNTVNDYRNMAANDGVPLPPSGLNWLNNAGNGGAAAPMLQGHYFNSWPSFFIPFQFPLSSLYGLSVPHLPDVFNQYYEGESASHFTADGFHELGHASHYTLVGEGYWVPYRNHIINNNGYGVYGNFAGNSDPGRVALGEAVGYFSGAEYGSDPGGGEYVSFNILGLEPENFIPRGMLWDLKDDSPGEIVVDPNDSSIFGTDNISGFTPAMFFDALAPDVVDIRSFRDRLRNLHLSDTPNGASDYNAFVDVYDVFH